MKILIISQVFYPDLSAVSQVLTDLAAELSLRGNKVNVFSSRNAYENPKLHYVSHEVYKDVQIKRLGQTGFGKSTKFGRVLDFASFNFSLLLRLLMMGKRKYDLIIGTTVPPLMSFIGVTVARLKKTRFCFWAMDLQPELSILAGYMKKGSLTARLLLAMGNYILQKADLIITLDRFMAEHIKQRARRPDSVKVFPVWPVVDEIYSGPRLSNPFRQQHGFDEKIVVMYSGNLSVVHPLDTLLKVALLLKSDPRFLFVFIGGGVRKADVLKFKYEKNLENIFFLPYQERDKIHLSLGAADIHAVIHGNGCTGYTHPSKIYGALFVGKPILYIGPTPSHITDILQHCPGNIIVQHGETEKLVKELLIFADLGFDRWEDIGQSNRKHALNNFNRSKLITDLTRELENLE